MSKLERNNPVGNSEEQIIEMREFISQVANEIIQKLKDTSGGIQIAQELFEVNFIN